MTRLALVEANKATRQALALILTSTGGYQVMATSGLDVNDSRLAEVDWIICNAALRPSLPVGICKPIIWYSRTGLSNAGLTPLIALNQQPLPAFSEAVREIILQAKQSKF